MDSSYLLDTEAYGVFPSCSFRANKLKFAQMWFLFTYILVKSSTIQTVEKFECHSTINENVLFLTRK